MKYLSLFSGIGGFELGIKQAYELQKVATESEDSPNDSGRTPQHSERPLCVGFSEIDKYAVQIYQQHFPEHKNYGDITKINAETLPDFDLLVGGFPCQSFSIAGKRGGFDDTRGTLFFEIARICKDKKPRAILLENVKGLLSHDNGNTFKTIIATLDDLGYDLQWQVLNSKNFGVPQNRERVFIIGHLRGTSRPQVFPIEQSSQGNLKYSGGVISAREQWLKDGKHNSRNFSQGQRIYSTEGISQTLAGQAGGQGGKTGLYQIDALQYKGLCDKLGVYASTQEENAIKILQELQTEIGTEAFAEWGLGILNSLQEEEVLQSILHGDSVRPEASQTESTMDDGSLPRKKDMPESELLLLWESKNRCSPQEPRLARQFIGELSEGLSQLPQPNTSWSIRRLTPKEAERLQGFPDGWTEGVSDTQRYKTLGNAVTVNVIREIMHGLI